MTEKVIVPNPRRKFYYPDGITPLAGGKIFTYEAGTTTKTTTWTDHTGLTPNTNPIILDSEGECDIWVEPLAPISVVPLPPGPPGPAGPPGIPGPPGPLGNATDYAITTDILSETIYNHFFGEYVVLVPAFGAGIVAIPTAVFLNYHYATVPYSVGGGNFVLYWGPPIIPVAIPNCSVSGVMLQGVTDKFLLLPNPDELNGLTFDPLDCVNKPITITFDAAIVEAALISIAVAAGGTGYVVNDTGTIAGGDTAATYRVTGVSTGAVTGIVLTFGGTGYSSADAAATATGGGQPGVGVGLTLDTVSTETLAGTLRVTVYYKKLLLAS
jgi:hypothetical protein